jgi:hypothetical protein
MSLLWARRDADFFDTRAGNLPIVANEHRGLRAARRAGGPGGTRVAGAIPAPPVTVCARGPRLLAIGRVAVRRDSPHRCEADQAGVDGRQVRGRPKAQMGGGSGGETRTPNQRVDRLIRPSSPTRPLTRSVNADNGSCSRLCPLVPRTARPSARFLLGCPRLLPLHSDTPLPSPVPHPPPGGATANAPAGASAPGYLLPGVPPQPPGVLHPAQAHRPGLPDAEGVEGRPAGVHLAGLARAAVVAAGL